MWRLIKWVVLLAIIAGVALWITGYKVKGKTIQEHLKPILEDKALKESVRDIRSIVGEGLKAAGEAISEDVTEDEKKQLDDVLKKELMLGKPIEGTPGQQALPPETRPAFPGAQPGAEPPAMTPPHTAPAPTTPPAAPKAQTTTTTKN